MMNVATDDRRMKTLLLCLGLIVGCQLLEGGTSIYFYDAKGVEQLNADVAEYANNSEAYAKVVQERGHKGLSHEAFAHAVANQEPIAMLNYMTWAFLDKPTESKSEDVSYNMILLSLYFAEDAHGEIRALRKRVEAGDDAAIPELYSLWPQRIRDLTASRQSSDHLAQREKLKFYEAASLMGLDYETAQEAWLINSLVYSPLRAELYARDFPTYLFTPNEFFTGLLSYDDQKHIRRIGKGGYLDFVLSKIEALEPGDTYYRDKEYFKEAVQRFEAHLNQLDSLGEGSFVIFVDNQ